MDEHIRGDGIDGSSMLHAIRVEPDLWHAVSEGRRGGVCIYTRETLITMIADLIGAGHLYVLHVGRQLPVQIDRAGNIWRDHEYLSPHQYLPELIKP